MMEKLHRVVVRAFFLGAAVGAATVALAQRLVP